MPAHHGGKLTDERLMVKEELEKGYLKASIGLLHSLKNEINNDDKIRQW